MKFRKTALIDAVQFRLGQTPYPAGVEAIVSDPNDESIIFGTPKPGVEGNLGFGIWSLEGWHRVTHEDWIVTNPGGERYAIKGSIFKTTYEPADDEAKAAWTAVYGKVAGA